MTDVSTDVERIASEISAGDDDAIEAYLAGVLQDISSAGADPNDVLPVQDETGFGFAFRSIDDPKSFWRAILQATQATMCANGGEVKDRIIASAAPGGGVALVAAIVAGIGVPPFAVGVAVVIAGIILAIGVNGLCIWLVEKLA